MQTENPRAMAAGAQLLSEDLSPKALFLRADQVSKMLGIAASTIRNQAAQGTFPIPHRRIGKAILFKATAVADWCSADEQAALAESAHAASVSPLPQRPEPVRAKPFGPVEAAAHKITETDRQRCARVKAEVLAIMDARRRGAPR